MACEAHPALVSHHKIRVKNESMVEVAPYVTISG